MSQRGTIDTVFVIALAAPILGAVYLTKVERRGRTATGA
jgi:hypothetical protein